MDYYFNITGIIIRIVSDIEISWNSYIMKFLTEPCGACDEEYHCRLVEELPLEGILVYRSDWQLIYKYGMFEERLHFFYGCSEPCMLYKEFETHKTIYLNKTFLDSFLREENYCIFNAMAFEKVLLKHRAIVLHSSFVVWKNQAILFTAPSGTGKSTQASLWEKYEGAIVANGDRTILKEKDARIYAYGMPICGSSDICLNVEVPLRAIVYLSQAKEDMLTVVDEKQKIKWLISETTINFFDGQFLDEALDIISHMGTKLDMYHLSCTKEKGAVDILREKLEETDDESA